MQLWLVDAIQQWIISDTIIDAHHIIQYLKYAATHQLFTQNGKTNDSDDRLSSVCASQAGESFDHLYIDGTLFARLVSC